MNCRRCYSDFSAAKYITIYTYPYIYVRRWGPISFRKPRRCKMCIRTKIYWLNDGGANSTKLLKYSRAHSSLTHSLTTIHNARWKLSLFLSHTPNNSRTLNIPGCQEWQLSWMRIAEKRTKTNGIRVRFLKLYFSWIRCRCQTDQVHGNSWIFTSHYDI